MAENFTPTPIVTFTNDTSAVNNVNGNFNTISSVLGDVLSRSGVSPNQMNSALDMNSNQILNLPPPSTTNSPMRLADLQSITGGLSVPPTGTSGAVVGFLNGNNIYSGTSTFTNNVLITPTPASTNKGLQITQSPSGTVSALQYAFNSITLTSDNIANTFGATFPLVDAMLITHNFGGSSFIGTAQGLEVDLNMTATTSASQPSRNYVGIETIAQASANDTGTNPTPQGSMFGFGSQAILQTGATFWSNLTAAEFNTQVSTGASVAIKTGIQIANNPADVVAGTTIDAMIWLFSQNNGLWKNGILFGGNNTVPIATTGTLIATSGSSTVTNGINFSSYTFTGNAIQTPGFTVLGSGVTQVSGTSSVSFIANQTSGQFSGYGFENGLVSKATILWDNTNNLTVFNSTAGAGGYSFNSNGTVLLFLANTGAMQFGSGGATGSWSANGAVNTALSALGPTGSHTTVQTWFTVADNTGTIRYIPAF